LAEGRSDFKTLTFFYPAKEFSRGLSLPAFACTRHQLPPYFDLLLWDAVMLPQAIRD
jgi:hypothetical protein